MTFDPKSMAAKSTHNKGRGRRPELPPAEPITEAVEKPPELELATAPVPPAEAPTPRAVAAAQVLIEVPVGEALPGNVAMHLDFRMTPRQAMALKHFWCEASRLGIRCTGAGGAHPAGKHVNGPTDGARLLLDRLADAVEECVGKNMLSDPSQIFYS